MIGTSDRTVWLVSLLVAVGLTVGVNGPGAADAGIEEPTPAGGWEARPDDVREPVADGKAREGAAGGAGGEDLSAEAALQQRLADVPCEDGFAGPFPCDNVDLLSFVPNAELGGGNGNDLWGWTDPATGKEYAIMGTGYTTAFVDISEPTDPTVVAWLPTESAEYIPLWRDIKVHDDHAFIVSEHTGHGMQIVDLTRLRDPGPVTPVTLTPDATYSEFSWAHNVAVNPDSGYAYVLGSDTCEGGLHMVDVDEPQKPEFAGCFSGDGYTHDAQCVIYRGPDDEHEGREICFAANEDTVTIVDVTDKGEPQQLSRTGYPTASYTHQGWLTPDQRWFVFGDEVDEMDGKVDTTTTYIMNVANLDAPPEPEPYAHDTDAVDHNLYIDGDSVFQANYTAGLRVLTHTEEMLQAGELDEIGFFDVVPHVDVAQFAGAWSNYPFYESGVVAVSTIEGGLFVLDPDLPESSEGEPDEERPGHGDDRRRDDERPGQGRGSSQQP